MVEEHKPGASGEIRTGVVLRRTLPPETVEYEAIDGLAIFEGDLILGTVQEMDDLLISIPPIAIIRTGDEFRWRNGVVPFQVDLAIREQFPAVFSDITDAIEHWEQNTGIRFIPRGSGHSDFVTFRLGNGCSSHVGRRGGEQDLNLTENCGFGSVVHEIGHAVGLWHEQSREDRDQFIRIDFTNIEQGQEHNFAQHVSDGDDFGPYDYGSIMHYGAFAFARDTSIPTIVAPQPIGQRNGLSAGDIAAVRNTYFFRRRGDSGSQAGTVGEIALIKHRPQQVVTAVRTAEGTLKIIRWVVNSDGSVSRTGDSEDQTGEASSIDIAQGSLVRYVTSCRTAEGDLKLISWTVGDTGLIVRAGDSADQAGTASQIKIVALSSTLFVTACRTADGNLKLISWRLEGNGSLTRLRDSGDDAGAVSEVSLAAIPGGATGEQRVLTAVRDSNGDLKLILWAVSTAGAFSRRGDSGEDAGEATMIRLAMDGSDRAITSVRDGDGDLKLISWRVSPNAVSRLSDSGDQAGEIHDNALMSLADRDRAVSAVRDGDGDLKLIAWVVGPDGVIDRDGDSYNLAGTASLVTLCPEALTGSAPTVTAVRTAEGTLKLITWAHPSDT